MALCITDKSADGACYRVFHAQAESRFQRADASAGYRDYQLRRFGCGCSGCGLDLCLGGSLRPLLDCPGCREGQHHAYDEDCHSSAQGSEKGSSPLLPPRLVRFLNRLDEPIVRQFIPSGAGSPLPSDEVQVLKHVHRRVWDHAGFLPPSINHSACPCWCNKTVLKPRA